MRLALSFPNFPIFKFANFSNLYIKNCFCSFAPSVKNYIIK
ncbi:hypothetical protein HMPREF9072_01507 [Capnocytophaga sp. oral taxon 324 str. F0483]|nr:hypothetical protein HMPREF9072_01507 [Capnocytophaga sp. oral taxon 324 str. F0483]